METSFVLSEQAEFDIDVAFDDGITKHGYIQAIAYIRDLKRKIELLAGSPDIARDRPELSARRNDVKAYTYGSHVVIYRKLDNHTIFVARVAHGRSNWQRDLDEHL